MSMLQEGVDGFLEEAVVRRELSDNFCYYAQSMALQPRQCCHVCCRNCVLCACLSTHVMSLRMLGARAA